MCYYILYLQSSNLMDTTHYQKYNISYSGGEYCIKEDVNIDIVMQTQNQTDTSQLDNEIVDNIAILNTYFTYDNE